ncbi:YegP family protein [Hansschlegelia beijingensis]|uniref:YegP family protein n=1 Tax=Hansschlegelia beijingensis TaxID=1133344 RepID=UPI00387F102A
MAEVTYPCYQQRKDVSGQWYWVYYASNGKALARSSESYHNRSDCTNCIKLLQASQNSPIFYFD